MGYRIARREFLKAAPLAAGAVPYAARGALRDPAAPPQPPTPPSTPGADYPIQPTRHSDVRLTDSFWKPKVDRNASVTIPFEVQKLTDGGRGFGGNVLEAAILSLATHPDPALQAKVDERVAALSK